ncbi:hypothetical protein [Nonomuraea sediminis]|uniref:hypothetical protein n=1 Tax=Nonomuraea sediminis TaxID=2835864 RepID=UPI001BDC3ABD|nr:hypothetical protein [Nonomuraea sediminis]
MRGAHALRATLRDLGISADVHAGHGVALVSVWVDLLIWCDGFTYRWWNGQVSSATGRRIYIVYSADNPPTAARAVAYRLSVVRQTHPLSPLIVEMTS